MRVVVGGSIKQPILLDTKEATAILIETDDGKPTVLFKMIKDGKSWLRFTKGEDAEFDEVARQLKLTS